MPIPGSGTNVQGQAVLGQPATQDATVASAFSPFPCTLYTLLPAGPTAGGRRWQDQYGRTYGFSEIPIGGLYQKLSGNLNTPDGLSLVLRTPGGDIDIEPLGRTGQAPNVSVPVPIVCGTYVGTLLAGVLTDAAN